MTILTVDHKTAYLYRTPVAFGEHRLMLRPRDSHDMRILGTSLATTPGASIKWAHDMFGNSVAVVRFERPSDTLRIESRFTIEHFPQEVGLLAYGPRTSRWPVAYTEDEREVLAADIARRRRGSETEAFAARFAGAGDGSPMAFLEALTAGIRADFCYRPRHAPGTNDPADTLRTRSGTCRDFAFLMMEAARSQGFAARFVTGYLYDPALDDEAGREIVGAGATHAWAQVYLPDAGWVEFDPTNGIVGGRNLIRVAAVRDPAQASPISGSWHGAPEDYVGMEVDVSVTSAPHPAHDRAAAFGPR
jgi:transglutaminase-like putative cysteine protease